MPGGRSLSNLGLQAFFDPGENGWDEDPTRYMSTNLLKLSVLTQGGVIDKVSATPGSPSDGDVYLFDETHATQPNDVAVYDVDTWKYFTPNEGWMLYNKAADYYEKFDGTVWAEFSAGGITDAPMDSTLYGREDGAWVPVPASGITDAPNDGEMYVRQSEGWTELPAYPSPGILEAPEDGTPYSRQDGDWVPSPGGGGGSDTRYVAAGFAPIVNVNNLTVFRHIFAYAVDFPSGLTGSHFDATANATATATYDIRKNGSSIGSLEWGTGSGTPTVTFSSAVSFADGDIMDVVGPATADTTLAGLTMTFLGEKA